jgi:ribose 1,5-bisphosphokinase PhnN
MSQPLISVVGPCGAGKTTLVSGLRARGINSRQTSQEHSYVRVRGKLAPGMT